MNNLKGIMSETKFTPGPWAYGKQSGLIHHVDSGVLIASVCGIHDTILANGVLLAAAPSLYEALTTYRQLVNNLAVALTKEQVAEAIRDLTDHAVQSDFLLSKINS